jgi:hypothetical protein
MGSEATVFKTLKLMNSGVVKSTGKRGTSLLTPIYIEVVVRRWYSVDKLAKAWCVSDPQQSEGELLNFELMKAEEIFG